MTEKTNDPRDFRFHLGEAYQHDRFPMKRLAEYLTEIQQFFGEGEEVYFIRLEKGSAVAVVRAPEPEDVPILEDGLKAVVRGNAAPSRLVAYGRFKHMLEEDAVAFDAPIPSESNIIEFPSGNLRSTEEHPSPDFGWFTQFDKLDGIPVEVGGAVDREQKRVKLKLRDGRHQNIYCDEGLANKIKLHMWHDTIRVEGKAQFKRSANGDWMMKGFRAADFMVLPNISLNEDIAALRDYPAKWKELEDPLRELDIIRHDEDIQ